ncbi:MAG TPA: 16S rRNA (cytidine(1402)-2'-O)-methyltransferase [Bacteroides sp.]|nr:16S rRNA (cytidine(1402)-2'-O)-methyltransferase [Bacteroides sp.]
MSKLFVVPTPVGNLEDITYRAIRILEEADLVLAEDTRKTRILLKHYNLSKKTLSHHTFNEHKFLVSLISRIRQGEAVALVSDAGTPGISDPGYLLIRECIRNDIEVEVLPGPTAFVPALVASGLPCDRFCFEGFLPQKKGRQKKLEELREETRTMIFYESPYRVKKSLEQFSVIFGSDRLACLARELTKIHEEFIRGTLEEIRKSISDREIKGECILIVGGRS